MASFNPFMRSKNATAPCSNSVPTMPRVGNPRPSRCQRSFQIVDADRNQRDSRLHEVPQSPDRDKQRSEKDQHHCLVTRLTLPSRLIMGMCRLLKEQSRPWLKSYVVPDPF